MLSVLGVFESPFLFWREDGVYGYPSNYDPYGLTKKKSLRLRDRGLERTIIL